MKSLNLLQQNVTQAKQWQQLYDDVEVSLELYAEVKEEAFLEEAQEKLCLLEGKLGQWELEQQLNGEYDANDALLSINAGAGGTDAQDWAEMMLRMYMRWAEKRGYQCDLIDQSDGEEAGIKSATIKLQGHYAFGYARPERGVHRLVRLSPFNSSGKRQTSFASVWVYPVIDDSITVDIQEKDLRVDTFRSSGAGGQHVNTTDSAIRITHLPTNIVVQCQSDRSQHRNRAEAMAMLRSRLYELELQKREAAAQATNASKGENSWGYQIRSYVLHPYQMVKDLRTGVETSATDAVLAVQGTPVAEQAHELVRVAA